MQVRPGFEDDPCCLRTSEDRQPLDAEQERAIEDRFAASNENLIKEFGSRIRNPTLGGVLFPVRPAADGHAEAGLGPQSIEVPELLDLMFSALSASSEPNGEQ